MEAHSQVPDPDSVAAKSKRDRKTRINDENNAPVGDEEDGKMNPSKRMKTAIARLRKDRSLREVNGQEADGGTGDADTPGKSSDGSEAGQPWIDPIDSMIEKFPNMQNATFGPIKPIVLG